MGGTGHDPELRSYLHVESEDPRLGGVRATVPRFAERDFDVLAFELPDDVERAAAKQALIAHLAEGRPMSTLPGLTEPIVRAIEIHRARAG
ncbi:hypothetical protein [Microbacterium sp. GCS4]|uniref:hypothetical protein n=1 Tax=Microbacterium sp. GCS4 TaxID=1692239 RepID=UPI00068014C8|nr:hypothetical protein [Microbacterium sp. GCS4]KNY07463.1 hypothetical protein AKH00_04115 [Microbacterium sp. GCS4]